MTIVCCSLNGNVMGSPVEITAPNRGESKLANYRINHHKKHWHTTKDSHGCACAHTHSGSLFIHNIETCTVPSATFPRTDPQNIRSKAPHYLSI